MRFIALQKLMISVTFNTYVLLQMSALVRCDTVTVQINLDHSAQLH